MALAVATMFVAVFVFQADLHATAGPIFIVTPVVSALVGAVPVSIVAIAAFSVSSAVFVAIPIRITVAMHSPVWPERKAGQMRKPDPTGHRAIRNKAAERSTRRPVIVALRGGELASAVAERCLPCHSTGRAGLSEARRVAIMSGQRSPTAKA